jgi:hypothetical protein
MDTKSTTEEVTHLTAELIGKLATAYGDTDKALTDRALAVNAALAYGVDVKTMAADMAAANRANPAIPAVVPATLGYARFAITVAEAIGTDLRAWISRDRKAVADTIRAGKRVGLKAAGTAVRDALKPIDKSKHFEREEIAVTVVTDLLSTILPEPAPATPRQKKSDGPDEIDGETGGKKETVSETMTAAAALATVRALTAWLTTGSGTWSPDLESALSELRTAATASRKRGQGETAKLKGARVETPAA